MEERDEKERGRRESEKGGKKNEKRKRGQG